MNVLGIETSCDETAVCIIDARGEGADFSYTVLGNALYSQASLHAQYGGVFPNLAKREHAKNLVPLLIECLTQAGEIRAQKAGSLIYQTDIRSLLEREPELFEQLNTFLTSHAKPHIDCIAVTVGPGLEPALWVGINFAKALAHAWNVPIVAVNHMEGHIVMPMMHMNDIVSRSFGEHAGGNMHEFNWPIMCLLVSGGHTELVLSREFGIYERIGETRDDAAGEAFDKVARLLDLPYPGGPEISRLAELARRNNVKGDFTFTRPMMRERNFDFSFSGLKTAVRNLVEKHSPLTDEMKKMIAREFEDTVAEVLVEKTLRAADEYAARTLVVGGGVSANARLRGLLATRVMKTGAVERILAPTVELATDNAIMIALAGYFHAARKQFAEPDTISANGNLRLM